MCWRGSGRSALRALRALTLASAALAAAPGCEEDTPVQRGFGSRQISQLREIDFHFEGARGDFVFYSIGPTPAESRYYSIDLGTGTVHEHDPVFTGVPLPPGYGSSPTGEGRFRCQSVANGTGDSQYLIDDTQTGARTVIEDPGLIGGCPTESDPTLEEWRWDQSGTITFWTGRYDEPLQMVPIDLKIVHITAQTYRSTDASVMVLAARPTAPTALGVFSIDMTSFAVTELVSPGLQGGAWADGATPAGALDSASLFLNSEFGAGVGTIGDHFRYWRAMAGGGETMFVGPFASGPARELALFQRNSVAAARVNIVRTPAPGVTTPPVWQRLTTEGPHEYLIWDDAGRRLVTCPSGLATAAGRGASSLDGTKLALFLRRDRLNSFDGDGPTGALQFVDLADPGAGSAPCRTLAPSDVSVADFSPDGTALFWLVQPKDANVSDELWLAASDGTAARLVGTDNIPGPPLGPRFVGPSRLQLQIDDDLVWLDTHDDPIRTHAIVEHVLGAPIDRGRWLIVGYDKSASNGTGRLGLVDREDGRNKRLISPDVGDFMTPDITAIDETGWHVIPGPRAAGDPIRIVYQVRGRNPSAQDGLWVATINASDTP